MKRILSGSLTHLAPPALMRLLSATATSGVLELVTDEGSFRMEIEHGWTAVPPPDQLEAASRVLSCVEGAFRFEPGDVPPIEGPSLSLGAFADGVRSGLRELESGQLTEIEIDRLVSGEIAELARSATLPNIHLLGSDPPVNPLDDLLEGLADQAPEELLFAQVGVVAPDPRLWRGAVGNQWRRRGWEVRQIGKDVDVDLSELDLLVVHQAVGVSRRGNEERWLDLVQRAQELEPSLPVVWAAPLGDPAWVHELVSAGVTFLLPVPPGEGGEVQSRFVEDLTLVVDRIGRCPAARGGFGTSCGGVAAAGLWTPSPRSGAHGRGDSHPLSSRVRLSPRTGNARAASGFEHPRAGDQIERAHVGDRSDGWWFTPTC